MSAHCRPSRKVTSPQTPPIRVPPPHETSTASPLERNPGSPNRWKKRESDGVGLGIVAALEKADRPSKIVVGAQKSAPIPVVPPRRVTPTAAAGDFPVADFLSCCYLCRKRLHGKDIFMYRGEKAFCSMECRYQQIVSDEYLEKFGSGGLRPSNISNSPCSAGGGRGQLFFTGIMAA